MRISLLSVHADWVRTFCVCLYLLSVPAGDGWREAAERSGVETKGKRENEIKPEDRGTRLSPAVAVEASARGPLFCRTS